MEQIPKTNAKQFIERSYLDTVDDIAAFLEKFSEWEAPIGTDLTAMHAWIRSLLEILPYPLTIIYEPYYVDRVYRDEYYRYYAKKHFAISRNCQRLIFIHNKYTDQQLLSDNDAVHDAIESDLIGAVVLKPTGNIGKTLIDPFKLKLPLCYVRTTKFEIAVLGRIYKLSAFPASGQDSEVMTCAEVNVWQVMEYFGTRYRDYRAILPGEMLDCLRKSTEVNILPSEGLTAEQEAYLFLCNGLSPRVYNKYHTLEDHTHSWVALVYDNPSLIDIMHFYIESGIPVLINLRDKNDPSGDNHCVTCIGHEYKDLTAVDFFSENGNICVDKSDGSDYTFVIVPSWRQYDRYVLMEDHSLPYQLKSIESLSFSNGEDAIEWEVDSIIVPLYKHVFMPAEDAYEIFIELFKSTSTKVLDSLGVCLDERSPEPIPRVVMRFFLTTSRAFKQFRIRNADSYEEKVCYSQVSYPKFLWVCEYGTPESYCRHKIKGEFILDATASKYGTLDSTISVRYGSQSSYRAPDDDVETAFLLRNGIVLSDEYAMFEQNNLKIGKETQQC